MANPIKASDLYIDDGAIKKAIDQFTKFRSVYVSGIREMKTEAKGLKAQQGQLSSAMGNHRKQISSLATEVNKLKAKYQSYSKALAKADGEITKLNSKLSTLSATQNKAAASANKQVAVTKKQGNAFTRLSTSIRSTIAAYAGFSAIIEVGRNIFDTTKKLDGLRLAFRKLSVNQTEYLKSTSFLNELTEDFGLELLSTSQAYLKYQAAVNTTTLGLKEGEQIFRSVSKAVSVLGLSTADAKGVFLALEQMISKGNVSSEELRQQMGERIPGAFQIMEKAVGASSGELQKMLRKGEVMSEEALPKFAVELEKAFGLEQLERIDTLAGAQNRLTNQWVRFVEDLDQRDIFSNVLNFLTELLKFTRENLTAIGNITKAVTVAATAWGLYRVSVAASVVASKSAVLQTIALATAQGSATVATRLGTIAMTAFNAAMRANPLGIVISLLGAATTAFLLFHKEAETSEEMITKAYEAVEEGETAVRNLVKATKDETKSMKERQSALEELQRIAPGYFDDIDIEKDKLKDLLKVSDKYNESMRQRAQIEALKDIAGPLREEIEGLEERIATKRASGGVRTGNLGMVGLGDTDNELLELETRLKERQADMDRVMDEIRRVREREVVPSVPEIVDNDSGRDKPKESKPKRVKESTTKFPNRSEEGRLDLQFLTPDEIRKFEAEHLSFLRSVGEGMPSLFDAKKTEQEMDELTRIIKEGKENIDEFVEAQEPKDIFDYLGIDVGPDGKEALKTGFDFAKDQLTSFFKLQKELTDERVKNTDRRVAAAENALDRELRLQEQGLANKVDLAQEELRLAKEQQEKAIKQKQKAVRAEQAIQTIQQGVNLVTAASKIFATVPFPFDLAAVGIMFGAFAAAKLKAFQLTKETFGEGGLTIIGGGTHASGNDTPLGFSVKGKPAYAEKGEAHGIVSAQMTRRYSDILPTLFDSLNNGTFERVFQMQATNDIKSKDEPMSVSLNADMSGTEKRLDKLQDKRYINESNQLVVISGNHKDTYV